MPHGGLQETAAVMLSSPPSPQTWHNLFPGQGLAGVDWRNLALPSPGEEQAEERGPCL